MKNPLDTESKYDKMKSEKFNYEEGDSGKAHRCRKNIRLV
jgi:hypothetical protein